MAQYTPGGHFNPHAAPRSVEQQSPPSTAAISADIALSAIQPTAHPRDAVADVAPPTVYPRNWAATISLTMGLSTLVGLGPVGSVFAIVFGHVGSAHGRQVGVGTQRAGWGLLLGYVTLLIWIIVVAVVIRWWAAIVQALAALSS